LISNPLIVYLISVVHGQADTTLTLELKHLPLLGWSLRWSEHHLELAGALEHQIGGFVLWSAADSSMRGRDVSIREVACSAGSVSIPDHRERDGR